MLKTRVIPVLLLKDRGLYKTVKFSTPKYVGDPINVVKIFNDKEVDELVLLDIAASKEGKGPDFELIEQCASECFMPLCYGGGIRNLDQVKRLFSLGIEKVCLQSAALEDLTIVSEISKCFGNQSVVVSVDIKKNWLGKREIYAAAKGKSIGKAMLPYLKELEAAGAGEIFLTAVDKEGTMKGMDLDLIKEASASVSIPLIASGGIGSFQDMKQAMDAGAHALGIGSFFVFQGPHRAVLISYPSQAELKEILK
jgi:cyclase